MRGPLDVLLHTWERTNDSDDSIVSHVLSVRAKLSKMSDLTHKNLSQAQDKQRQWYDKNSREQKFNPGDQILVLLLTDRNKLLAQWQGPYTIVKQIRRVNYQVEMHDRRKHKRVFHVNMLRPWYSAPSSSYLSTEVSENEQDDIPLWCPDDNTYLTDSQPALGTQLTPQEQ